MVLGSHGNVLGVNKIKDNLIICKTDAERTGYRTDKDFSYANSHERLATGNKKLLEAAYEIGRRLVK